MSCFPFFFNDIATTEIDTYGHTLSLHDALPISRRRAWPKGESHVGGPIEPVARAARRQRIRYQNARQTHGRAGMNITGKRVLITGGRSEEHTSELQSLMRISYAAFCLKKKKLNIQT